MVYMIFKDDEQINTIIASPSFVETYCAENGYTYEAEICEEPDTQTVYTEPEPEPEPTAEDVALDLMAEHEERICMLELNA